MCITLTDGVSGPSWPVECVCGAIVRQGQRSWRVGDINQQNRTGQWSGDLRAVGTTQTSHTIQWKEGTRHT